MRSEPEMRMPYGPGWEDPDWTPHASPPEESAEMKLQSADDAPPEVSTLSQFMAIVRRFARPIPLRMADRPPIPSVAPAGQTRRWVMAGGAGLVALATLPGTRTGTKAPDEQARIAIDASPRDGRTPGTGA